MKIFLKQNQLKELIGDDTIIKCGYKHLAVLLKDITPMFYYKDNSGLRCDIYRIEKHKNDMSIEVTYIITGYDTLKRVKNNNTYEISYFDCNYYNNLAQDRSNQYIFHCDKTDCKNAMRTLIYEMIDSTTRNSCNKIL